MDLRIGTAICAEKHFSHTFRTPFSPGQIFGLVPINYSILNAVELDTCLLNLHCDDGESFPSASIRGCLTHLLDCVRVDVSSSITGRVGNPNLGLFISYKKKGDVVGIYSGISSSTEFNDSLYLFQLDVIS
jgi:hypothetical protein